MEQAAGRRKRKAATRDSRRSNEAALYDELGNGVESQDVLQAEARIPLAEALELSSEDEGSSDELFSDEEDERYTDSTSSVLIDRINGGSASHNHSSAHGTKLSGQTEDYMLEEDANGDYRYVYREIDPIYDSDDSEAPPTTNTIGNIPLSLYDSYPHIGYDIDGKKVMRPAKGQALDSLLDSIEIPEGWTGLTDPATGQPLELKDDELQILKSIARNEVPDDGYDPYPDYVDYFTGIVEQMPLNAAPEPKRRFVPSKHEAKRVMKLVRAIKEGRIQPYRKPSESDDEDDLSTQLYDVWSDEGQTIGQVTRIPAPKPPPPGFDQSYNPPPEYLPDDKETDAWQKTDEEDREKEYLPQAFGALRLVPGYDKFVKERFERSLDLYLAPRVRRSKLDINPEDLLPKLPDPQELKPFPEQESQVHHVSRGRVRTVAFNPIGDCFATGDDYGIVAIWTVSSGRLLWKAKVSETDPVDAIRWRPGSGAKILAAAAGPNLFLISPPVTTLENEEDSEHGKDLLNAGWSTKAATASGTESQTVIHARWTKPERHLQAKGVLVQVICKSTIKVIAWHRKGDYFATVAPQGQRNAVAIHTLSKHQTQLPFSRLKGLPQSVRFHPTRPIFFVATQRIIRSYDLAKQELLKILQTGARWISDFDVHNGGENLIVSSFDRRLLWLDMELSTLPYKTLRYHTKAIRSVRFHPGGFPLFVDASDDGTLQVFHGKVFDDSMDNASIIPLKVLRGHKIVNGLGVLEVDWHPSRAMCASAGADGTVRFWESSR